MVLNAAMQMLREAEELKQNILKFKSGTSMLQERSLWVTQQQLQKIYQKLLVLDLDYALEKKVEQDLWNVGFKQQIDALQSISKDRKNPLRSEGQAMLSWVLQAAAGFYLCLLHQICTAFKLDLPFRRRASLLGWVEEWGAAGEVEGGGRQPAAGAARYISQHCLVHLGDLARYRQHLRVAHTFYRQALVVSAHSGQPYNQLALVAWRRGRRLAALYWHVRSLLVRAPFPPAPANLARTLHAAASGGLSPAPLPALGTPPPTPTPRPSPRPAPRRLDAHAYVTELIRAMNFIHTVEQLDTAAEIIDSLNMSLTSLIATDSFESMTLVKMACVLIWLVHSSTEDFKLDSSSLSEEELKAAELSETLAANMLLALLLPTYTLEQPAEKALPAVKVWVQWGVCQAGAMRGARWAGGALWAALGATLAALPAPRAPPRTHDSLPLPEDEELQGFLPLEAELQSLRFSSHAAWDSYGGRVPTDPLAPPEALCPWVPDSALQRRERAGRLRELGARFAAMRPEYLVCTEVDGEMRFEGRCGGEEVGQVLARLAAPPSPPSPHSPDSTGDIDSDDEPQPPPPPVIISEADFREKVREKRAGILKPQGSLERAREERAMANTQDEQESDGGEESLKTEDKKETRKPRVNIAMAAIMRKQEETNKQVKFVTPSPTPDSAADATEKDQEKPRTIQPKAIKGLVTLPLGRKTGGILSLKDKSAGYPHLVNTDSEPKVDADEKKETKATPGPSHSQTYQPKRKDHAGASNWTPNVPPPNSFNENPRMNFQKNYGLQSSGIIYNPNYSSPPNVGNQSIRLPVVNPKEIDVRTAAMQKQTSRQELFHDGNKFSNHNYQVSGDKKNFLNDLPPRFANQYRYWQTAHENQFNDNKFRDESFKQNNSVYNTQQPNWANPPQLQENYQQPMPWWKPENPPPNYNTNYPQQMTMQPNFYSPHLNAGIANRYQSVPYNQLQSQNIGQQTKQEPNQNIANYLQSAIGQPQLQSMQNMVGQPNFNAPMTSFGTYAPSVGYDSSMYPQFNKGYQQMQMKMGDNKQGPSYQPPKDMKDVGGLSYAADPQQRKVNVNFKDPLSGDGAQKKLDSMRGEGPRSDLNTSSYSLFSGAQEPPSWGVPGHHHAQQSFWSGPGPSPLERLLDQQKQLKQPSAPH